MKYKMISDISNIITALSVFGTAIIALLGLRSWQNEMKGKTEYEIARKVMRSAYRLVQELNYSRSPLQNLPFPDGSEKNKEEKNLEAHRKLYSDLLHPIFDAYTDLESCILDAQVIWGEEITVLAHNIKRCVHKYQNALELNLDNIQDRGEIFRDDREIAKENKKILYAFGESDNVFTKEIQDSLNNIELFIRPRLGLKARKKMKD